MARAHPPARRWDEALEKLARLAVAFRVELIAIGNGTASRETDKLAGELIRLQPDLKLTKYLSSDKSPINYAKYSDPTLDDLYERQSREQNLDRRKQLVWEFERRLLGETAHQVVILGQVRSVALWNYVKGWKVTPSHYLNQDLATVWLAR